MTDGPVTDRSHRRDPQRRQVSRSIIVMIIVMPMLAAVALALFAGWAATRIDSIALKRESALLQQALSDSLGDMRMEQLSITHWDDAFFQTKAGNHQWMADNIAEWMHDFFGHDEVIIIDPNDLPIHGMSEGKSFPPSRYMRVVNELKPQIARLRGELKTTDDLNKPFISGWTIHRGRPAMICVRPILPIKDLVRTPSELYLHIDIKYLDGAVLNDIGKRHQLSQVRFLPLSGGIPDTDHFPFVGISGGTIGYIGWTGERPGFDLLAQTAPGLVGVTLLILGLICWLVMKLRKSMQDLDRRQKKAEHLALHDALTGLANRAMMNARLEEDLLGLRGGRLSFALHYIDLDRFKHVNDTLGHPAGDNLIRQVADRLRAAVRPVDLVARLGGDEFAIIQADTDERAPAADLADKILRSLRLPFDLDGHQAYIDGSVGIAIAAPEDSRSELIRKADIALYEVKGNGKGHHCFFETKFDEDQIFRHVIETDLHRALDQGTGISLMFQPFFAADGTTVRGAEALLRWDHPTFGEVEPEVFVPIAEERGLMPRLGKWVFEEAIRVAVLANLPSVAINVSAAQFRDEELADKILGIAESHNFSPGRLRLEITESMLLESANSVSRALTKLRFAGVHVSLDDFGTGYSSLNYLRRYKVDGIKIDRSFIRKLGAPDNSDAIVRAILDLANALLLDVIAEGVENEYQWDWCLAAGCTEFQGFFFASPLNVENLCALCDMAGDRPEGTAFPQSWAS